MSQAITFDTLRFVKRLESAGMEQKQAEAFTRAVNDVFEENLSTSLFTKQDGRLLENKLDKLGLGFDAKLSKLEVRIVLWVVGLLLAQNALIFGLLKLAH